MPEPLPSIHQVFSLNTSLHPSIMLVWLRSSKPPGPRHVWNKLASKPRFLKIRGPKYMKAFLVQGGQVNKQKNTTRKPADTEIWESVPLKKWYTGFIYIGMSCNWTNQTRHTYIYDDQHFLPLNIENEIASFKPTLWSVLPSLFFFLEKVSDFVSMRIWNKNRKMLFTWRWKKKAKQYKQMRERMIKQYDNHPKCFTPLVLFI